MVRLSGVYKRRTRGVALLIAAAITIVLNVDTLSLTTTLWQSATLRSYLVEHAKVRLSQGAPVQTVEYTQPDVARVTPVDTTSATKTAAGDQVLDDEMAMLGQLFGWKTGIVPFFSRGLGPVFWSLVGWLLTALAVSLGAPFWFDLLNRFMSFRSAGNVPDSTSKEPVK